MLDKLKGILEAQKKMSEIKKGLEQIAVDYASSDNKIKLSMDGTQKVTAVEIDDELLQPAKKAQLQNLLRESINAASVKVQRIASEKLKSTIGDFKIPGL